MDHHRIQKMIPMYSSVTVSQLHISVPDSAVKTIAIADLVKFKTAY